MESVPAPIAELDERLEQNRGEYLPVCYDGQPKMTALPVFPTICRLMNEETSK